MIPFTSIPPEERTMMTSSLPQRRNAQVWTIDFIAGLLLFIVALFLGLQVILSMTATDTYSGLYRDGVHLSTTLLTPGYPEAWNITQVIVPGLVTVNTTNRIDPVKLQELDAMSYGRSKVLFRISHEYIYFFRNNTNVINITRCVHGYAFPVNPDCTPNLSTLQYKQLVRIDRLVIYNSTPVMMVIYTWE